MLIFTELVGCVKHGRGKIPKHLGADPLNIPKKTVFFQWTLAAVRALCVSF